MKVEYQVCDRCGEKISHHSRLLAKTTIPKKINILWILCGIVSERKSELCGKCSDELEEFMRAKPDTRLTSPLNTITTMKGDKEG